MVADGRGLFCTKAAHQNIRLRMHIGLLIGELALVYKRLHVGMVYGAMNQFAAMKMVDAGIPRMNPVAVSSGIDQKSSQRTVRFLLCRLSRQFDDDLCLVYYLRQQRGCVIAVR